MSRPRAMKRFLIGRLEAEMAHQDEKWGWPRPAEFLEDDDRRAAGEDSLCRLFERVETRGRHLLETERPCWQAILAEEIGEVARETDEKRVAELIQVAAVALSWAQSIEASAAETRMRSR